VSSGTATTTIQRGYESSHGSWLFAIHEGVKPILSYLIGDKLLPSYAISKVAVR
jgi:hypothetical protein